MKLHNKYAIVTGATTGIGRAIALELGKQNFSVGLVGRSEDKLQDTKSLIELNEGKANVLVADLSKPESIKKFTEEVKRETNHVDALVNVAGIWHGKDEVYANRDFETFSEEVIVDTFMVGTIAPTLLAHAFIPLMPQNGKIVNISGTFENGAKGWLPYFVSKKAIEDLTIGLAEELADKNIQVNAVSPSDTATDAYKKYFPEYIPEAIIPEEIAKQAAYLCSEETNGVTGKVFVMKKGKEPYEGYHS